MKYKVKDDFKAVQFDGTMKSINSINNLLQKVNVDERAILDYDDEMFLLFIISDDIVFKNDYVVVSDGKLTCLTKKDFDIILEKEAHILDKKKYNSWPMPHLHIGWDSIKQDTTIDNKTYRPLNYSLSEDALRHIYLEGTSVEDSKKKFGEFALINGELCMYTEDILNISVEKELKSGDVVNHIIKDILMTVEEVEIPTLECYNKIRCVWFEDSTFNRSFFNRHELEFIRD